MNDVMSLCKTIGITVKGILHVGAHTAEELVAYNQYGITNVVWVEANAQLVEHLKQRGINNVIHAAVSDKEQDVTFHISNNKQSSSILELGTHLDHYPSIQYIAEVTMKSKTLKTIYEENQLDVDMYNMWNLDIQGVELLALKGAQDILNHVDVIYTEVNYEAVYKNCPRMWDIDNYLRDFGFTRFSTSLVGQGWGDAVYLKNRNL